MPNDFNISPEMINNIANMLKNNTTENNDTPNSTQIDINQIMNKISNMSASSNSTPNSNYANNSNNVRQTNTIDADTILKIQNIMSTLNTNNDAKSNLLNSLKPYLRKNKQEKLDQYSNLLKVSQISGLFNLGKGEK